MTAGEFGEGGQDQGLGLSPRDMDLLADYVGGALADTPAQAQVATRITDDPVWRRAHAALTEAAAAVTADLGAWGRSAEPMPDSLVARLSAALAADADGADADTDGADADTAGEAGARAETGPAETAPVRSAGLSVVPGGRMGPPRRRWARWAAPVAAAAAVLAFCGFGLRSLPQGAEDSGSAGLSGGDTSVEAPYAEAMASPPVRLRVASGTDYTPASLPQAREKPVRSPARADQYSTVGPAAGTIDARDRADPALDRLGSEPALAACLAAVDREHPDALTNVELADYAAFQGSPALVLIFTDTARLRWAWAVGPDCGLAGAGADTRYRAKVG